MHPKMFQFGFQHPGCYRLFPDGLLNYFPHALGFVIGQENDKVWSLRSCWADNLD